MIYSLTKIIFICFFTMLAINGCSTYTIATPDTKTSNSVAVNVGNTVYIKTKDQQEQHFIVTSITESHIIGVKHNIAKKDILSLSRKDFSTGRTIGATTGTLAAILILVLAVAF